jgi:hypothetical protein
MRMHYAVVAVLALSACDYWKSIADPSEQIQSTHAFGGAMIDTPPNSCFNCPAPKPDDWFVQAWENGLLMEGPAYGASMHFSSFEYRTFPDQAAFEEHQRAYELKLDSTQVELVSSRFSNERIKGASCLRYDLLYRNKHARPTQRTADGRGIVLGSGVSAYYARLGHFCRHPKIASYAMRFELIMHSEELEFRHRRQLEDIARRTLNTLTFTTEGL